MDFKTAAEKLKSDGYAIIEDFLTPEEIKALKDRMHEIVAECDPKEHQTTFVTGDKQQGSDYFLNSGDKIAFFFEEKAIDSEGNLTVDKQLSVNKIGHALHCLDPVFSKITQSDKMKDLVKALGFCDPVICQSMYIFKQPRIGGDVVPHQDSTYLATDPPKLIGVWIPLEDALKDNSCLWFYPGSHKEGTHNNRFFIRNPDKSSDPSPLIHTNSPLEYDDAKFVPAEMKAGSLALIHGDVVHKSAANTSDRSRHAYTFHLFEAEGVQYSKRNWLQPTEKGTFTHLFA